MSDAALSSILATLPENRIAFLEQNNIASRLGNTSRGLVQRADDALALAQNRVIERMLVHRIRKAIRNRLKPDAAETFLNSMRRDYDSGRRNTLTVMSRQPASESESAKHKAEQFDASQHLRNVAPTLFYIPGGGFILPPTRKQREIATTLASRTGCRLHLANHRLAPEDPFPAAVEDICDAYFNLTKTENPPSRIIMGADTAGASILMGAMMRLRDQGFQLPAGLLLFSPWCDLSLSGWSYISQSVLPNSPFRMETAAFCARLYLANTLATEPLASTIFGNLAGFSPILIHTSTFDMHFDDAVRLAEIGHENGCRMQLHYWESPRHHLERLHRKDAEKSYQRVAEFVASCITQA